MASSGAHTPYDREKRIRLTTTQTERLERAAQVAGVLASEFIREAIERRCDEVLQRTAEDDWAGYIGVLELKNSPGAPRLDEVVEAAIDEKLSTRRRRSL